jgi:hypothetical protein
MELMNRRDWEGMNGSLKPWALLALFFVLSGVGSAAEKEAGASGLSELSVSKQLEAQGGDFSDLFVHMKAQPDFKRLSRKHGLDDPAVWPTLRQRFTLNLAELQGRMNEAESMIATRDSRGGLNDAVMSAEKTRAKGRRLKEVLDKQIEEVRQLLRLIEEFTVAFNEMGPEELLADEMELENKQGQSLTGQVLFVDGKDLIVRRKNAGYFRIPVNLLSEDTRMAILAQVYRSWDQLPELNLSPEAADKNAGELLAYSDAHLYIDDRFEGFVCVPRSNHAFTFTPYEERIESINEEAKSARSRDRAEREALLEELEEALRINQSRIDAIDWHQSRLGVEIPESERTEAQAYREENYGEPEADTDESTRSREGSAPTIGASPKTFESPSIA